MMAHVSLPRRARWAVQWRVLRRSLLLACLAGLGCTPLHEGPQLRSVPDGLAYTSTISSARLPLRGRQKTRQVAYLPTGEERWPLSVIITEYAGVTNASEVRASHQEYVKRYGESTDYGQIETVTIDGREGWGWLETYRYRAEVMSVGFTVILPYDSVSYSVEVTSRKPKLKDEAYLRELAASFVVRYQTDYDAWILIVGGLALGGILVLVRRAQLQPARPDADTVTRLLRQ